MINKSSNHAYQLGTIKKKKEQKNKEKTKYLFSTTAFNFLDPSLPHSRQQSQAWASFRSLDGLGVFCPTNNLLRDYSCSSHICLQKITSLGQINQQSS